MIVKALSLPVILGLSVSACAPAWRGGSHMGAGSLVWNWPIMSAFSFLGTFLAVLAALFVFRWLTDARPTSDALNSLKQRYAKGEMTREEFDRIKKELAG